MKKFKFTLQTLLNVKLAMEKRQKGELSECNARIHEFTRQQEANYAKRRQQAKEYNQLLQDGMPLAEVALWRGAFVAIRQRILEQNAVIERTEDERERIQAALLSIMRERKALEALRDKQLEEYKALQKAEDAAAMDEFLSHQVYKGVESIG